MGPAHCNEMGIVTDHTEREKELDLYTSARFQRACATRTANSCSARWKNGASSGAAILALVSVLRSITRTGMSALAPVYTRSKPTNLFLAFTSSATAEALPAVENAVTRLTTLPGRASPGIPKGTQSNSASRAKGR